MGQAYIYHKNQVVVSCRVLVVGYCIEDVSKLTGVGDGDGLKMKWTQPEKAAETRWAIVQQQSYGTTAASLRQSQWGQSHAQMMTRELYVGVSKRSVPMDGQHNLDTGIKQVVSCRV